MGQRKPLQGSRKSHQECPHETKFETSNVEVKSFPAKVSFLPDKLLKKKKTLQDQRTWVLFMILFFDANHVFFLPAAAYQKTPPTCSKRSSSLATAVIARQCAGATSDLRGKPRSCTCQGNQRRQRQAPQPPHRHPVRLPRVRRSLKRWFPTGSVDDTFGYIRMKFHYASGATCFTLAKGSCCDTIHHPRCNVWELLDFISESHVAGNVLGPRDSIL